MIRSFRHRGLKRLFEDGERNRIRPDLVEKSKIFCRCWTQLRYPGNWTFRASACTRSRVIAEVIGQLLFVLIGELSSGLRMAMPLKLILWTTTEDDPMPMKNPPHPGRIVRQDCLKPLGLTVTEGARVLGVTRQALNNVVNGKSGISPEMSFRLSKAFGSTPELWLQLQMNYDLAQFRRHADEIAVERYQITELRE